MPKVELVNSKKDQLIPMGEIPVGKLAVVVETMHSNYIGQVVMGLPRGDTLSLNTGASWDSLAGGNKCRLLEPSEQVRVSGNPVAPLCSTDLNYGQLAKVVEAGVADLVGKTVMCMYGGKLVSLVDAQVFRVNESIKVRLLSEGEGVVLDNME